MQFFFGNDDTMYMYMQLLIQIKKMDLPNKKRNTIQIHVYRKLSGFTYEWNTFCR